MYGGASIDEMIKMAASRRADLDKEGIYFLRDINEDEAERFGKAMYLMGTERSGYKGRDINIYINSGGGSVGAGFAMMEMMFKVKRDFKVRVNTIVTGYAYSMGAIILQGGDWRKMGYFSSLMLHGGYWQVSGEDQKVFKDYGKLSDLYQGLIGDLFAKRTGKHDAKWWQRYIYSGRDRFLSASECLELGLVDEVCDYESCYIDPSKLPKIDSLQKNSRKKTTIIPPVLQPPQTNPTK
ncbi:MAG: hypothetical protein EXR59_05210 [Dehalococcoidia bacterium]|nr:hypothetical protein [Dehalococcoidia bacterium]